MKITKRMKTILSFVPTKGNIFDIGCDHGIIAVYLALNRRCVTAIDIHEKALEKAINLSKEHHVYDQMKFYVQDGIGDISISKEDTLILTGMGGYTIMHILKKQTDGTLIIEAHTDIPLVRKELSKKGFYIKDEKAIFDKKWYVIMKWEKGNISYQEEDYFLGPFCKKNQDYLKYLKSKYQNIYEKSKDKQIKEILDYIEKNTI